MADKTAKLKTVDPELELPLFQVNERDFPSDLQISSKLHSISSCNEKLITFEKQLYIVNSEISTS